MRRLLLTLNVIVVAVVLAGSAAAVTSVATDPVGFTTMSQLSNSDTLISIPFTRPPAFTGAISSASGQVITVSGAPWSGSQFVYAQGTQPNHYYVLLGPAGSAYPKEGRIYDISANTTNTLTVTTADNLSDVPAGAQILVIPKWTLGTLFPSTDQNVSFTPTTATRTPKTEILIPNYNAVGPDQGFGTVYIFSNNVNGSTNNVGWRLLGDNTTPHDDDPLSPVGFIGVRNLNSAPTLPVSPAGAVLTKKVSTPLVTQASQAQDNAVSMVRPVDLMLTQTGLNPTDGSFVATTSTRSIKDELLLYDNNSAVLNKSPSRIYIYGNNINGDTNNGIGWRLLGDNATDHGSDSIPAGSAMVIRKAASAGGNVYWTNSPTY